MAKIDVKGTSDTVIYPDFNPVEFDGISAHTTFNYGGFAAINQGLAQAERLKLLHQTAIQRVAREAA